MSTKDLFNKNNKVLTKSDSEKIKREIESFELIKDEMRARERIRPLVDYSDPVNFAKYGSSVKYYEDSFARVYKTYPYDGSLSEKKKWINSSSDLDLWILANVYPKFVGHIRLSNTQQVFVKGGPNNQPGVIEGEREELSKQYPVKQGNSNIWNPKIYRNSNIYIDQTIGNTVEFWAKLEEGNDPFKLFSIGNEDGEKYSVRYYPSISRLRPTVNNNDNITIEDSFYHYPDFINTDWNHYAFAFSNINGAITIEIYKNGSLVDTHTKNFLGDACSQVGTYLYINGDVTNDADLMADGLYIDEFRYWKTRRTEQDIGRYWFTDISGGTNTDENKYSEENRNVDIGVYLKFNEGIIGDADIDSIALDYSGRISNGTITNYSKDVRRLTSAIDESTDTDEKESPDPVLYPNHQDYVSTLEYYTNLAMIHDTRNNSSIYHTLPGWVTDEDSVSGENIKELTQVLSSFFDDFHLKVENLPNLGKKDYYSLKDDVDKPSYLAKIGIKSLGFEAPDIFTEASLIEDILSRSEQYSFEENLEDIKNTIYQNIYNNLSYIYKSKGTEKSFRNLIRCFGIDDELVRLNIYSNNSDYTVEEESSRRTSYTKKNFVDFNNPARNDGFIQTEQDPNNPDTTIGYIRGAYNNWNYISSTIETEVLFPKRISEDSPAYFNTPNTEENILSVLRRDNNSELFSVVAYKQGTAASNSVKFNLDLGGLGSVETPYFHDVYENSRFNIAVRLKPVLESPDSSMLGQQSISYVAELYCVRMLGDTIEDESVVSLDLVDYDGTIISKDKILKLGETSQGLDKSHKVSSTLYWYDYLTNKEIQAHASDGANYGRLNPTERVYSHIIDAEITRADTLALYWDFNKVSTTDANGQFIVDDLSEQVGSTAVPVNQKSIQLDGIDDHIIVSDQDEFSFTNGANDLPFSISAWVYVGDVASDNGPFVTKSNNTLATRNEYIFKQANGSLQFFLYDSAASAQGDAIRALANSASLTSGTWHHVVATYDGSEQSSGIKLYTDGSQTLSTNSEAGTYIRTRNTDTALTFGATEDLANANRVFEDRLADICIFNKELSPEEVQELYNYNSVLDMNNFSDYGSIISWWKMGDGDDVGQDNVVDSVSGFHGTLTNGASIINENALDSQQVYSGRFDWFTSLVNSQVSGIGTFLNGDDDQVTNREYIQSAKYRNPGVIGSEDLVEIGTEDYEVFTRNTKPAFNFFTIEKSMYQVIDDDILNLFSSIVEFNNLIGQPVNRYRMEYKSMQHFRQKYFETVKNVPSLEKYVEYYKWIDTSIGLMIRDLIPASSDFSSDLRTMVESHILERNKYWTKFPTLEMKQDPPEGQILGIRELTYNWEYGHAEPTGQPVNLKAISFDGDAANSLQSNTDIVISADSDVFTFSDSTGYDDGANHLPFTLSAWVKLDTYDRGVIISKFSSKNGPPNDPGDNRFDNELIFWHLNNGQVGMVLYDSKSSFTGNRVSKKTNSVLNLNQWHHVAATFDGTVNLTIINGSVSSQLSYVGIKIYVDGQEVPAANDIPIGATNYQVVRNTLAPLTIGAMHYDTTGTPDNLDTLYNGDIADVVIFSKELSSDEIEELYNFGNVKDMNKHSAFDDIISWWKMGDDSDTATPDGIIDYVGGNHGTMSGQASIVDAPDLPTAKYTPEQNLRCLWEKERANRTDAVVSTTGIDNPESAVDTNREVIRNVATRDVKGLSQVVERNGFFVEESKPILRTESNQTYEGNTYVTRRLSKPYILTANRDKTIRAGVNYSETTKDPNAFARTSTDIGKGLQLNGLTDNPQECVTNLSKRKYKRSSTITINQESFDGSFIFPYYGQSNRDQSAQMTNIHSDSYGDDAEVPLQGPFTSTWVGGNQHRHVPVGTEQAVRPELYINDAGTLKHPHDVSKWNPSARYTRDELAKRPVNVENIKTTRTQQTTLYNFQNVATGQQPEGWSFVGNPTVQNDSGNFFINKALAFINAAVDIPAEEAGDFGVAVQYRIASIDRYFQGPLTVSFKVYEGRSSGDYGTSNPPEADDKLWFQYSTDGENWATAGEPIDATADVWDLKEVERTISQSGRIYLRWVAAHAPVGDFDHWAIDNISITHYAETLLLGNYQRDYEVVQTSSRTKNNRWFVKNNGVLPGVLANPYIADNPQYVLPDRGRHEHIFVERFSAPGDANTLSRGQLDRIAEEYSVYNSMNYRNLDDRELHHNELYTHSDLFEGSQGYYAGSAGKASIHKVNRNTNYMPIGNAHDNAYISFQIPRSGEQYNLNFEPGTVYAGDFDFKGFSNIWSVSNGDVGYDSNSDGSFDSISLSPGAPSIVDPPSDPSAYEFASLERIQTFDNPVTVEFTISEQGELTNPNTTQDLYLQYRVGEGEWTTKHIFLAAPANSVNYEDSNQSFHFDYGQSYENRLQIRWVARSVQAESKIWSISNVRFIQRAFSSYSLDGTITSGSADAEYSDYGASGWRFIRNSEKKAVIRQRNSNTISVLDKPTSAKRRSDVFTSHVEPAAVWHKPAKHRVFAASDSLHRTEINLLRSQDRLFNDLELNFAFALGTRTVTHSYSNNLEMFSNPNLSRKVDLVKNSPQFMEEITSKISNVDILYDKVITTEIIYPKRRNVGLGKVRNKPFFDDYRAFWNEKFMSRVKSGITPRTGLGFSINDAFRKFYAQQYSVYTVDNFMYRHYKNGVWQGSFRVLGDLSYVGKLRQGANITKKGSDVSEILSYNAVNTTSAGLDGIYNKEYIPTYVNLGVEVGLVPSVQLHYPHPSEPYGWLHKKVKRSNSQPQELYDNFSLAAKFSGQNYAIISEYNVSEHMDKYVGKYDGNFFQKNCEIFTLNGASYNGSDHTRNSGKKTYEASYSVSPIYIDSDHIVSAYPRDTEENENVFNCATEFEGYNNIYAPVASSYSVRNSVDTDYEIPNSSELKISGPNYAGSFNIEMDNTSDDFVVVNIDYLSSIHQNIRIASVDLDSDGEVDSPSSNEATPFAISVWVQPEGLDIIPATEMNYGILSMGSTVGGSLSLGNATLFSRYFLDTADADYQNLGLTFVIGQGQQLGFETKETTPGADDQNEVVSAYTFFRWILNEDATAYEAVPAILNESKFNHVAMQFVPPRLPYGSLGTNDGDSPFFIKMWLNSEVLYGVHINELNRIKDPASEQSFMTHVQAYNPCPIGGWVTDSKPFQYNYNVTPGGDFLVGSDNGFFGATEIDNFVLGNGSFYDIANDTIISNAESGQYDRRFYGFLDEFSVFKGILLDAHIKEIFNSGKPANLNTQVSGFTSNQESLNREYDFSGPESTNLETILDENFEGYNDGDSLSNVTFLTTGGIVVKQDDPNNPVNKAAAFLGATEQLTITKLDGNQIVNGKFRRIEFKKPITSSFVLSFTAHEHDTQNVLYGLSDQPEDASDDRIFVQKSLNNGATWTTVEEVRPGRVYPAGKWNMSQKVSVTVRAPVNTPIKLRLVAHTHGSTNDHWAIDNIIIHETQKIGSFAQSGVTLAKESNGNVWYAFVSNEGNPDTETDGALDPTPIERTLTSFGDTGPVEVSYEFDTQVPFGRLPHHNHPEPELQEHLYFEWKLESDVGWTVEKTHSGGALAASGSETVTLDKGQSLTDKLFFRWRAVDSHYNAPSLAIRNIVVLSEENETYRNKIIIYDDPQNWSYPYPTGISFEQNWNFEVSDPNDGSVEIAGQDSLLEPGLIAWHRIGIPEYESDCFDWDDEFFNSYVHTNNIPFIEKVDKIQEQYGVEVTDKKVVLKVDAIKKLLPYDGFYPQDRTVQIAKLFVEKLEGVDSLVGYSRHEDVIHREQSIQALLQHFFAPGILYNTIKSGIACDWACYTNDSGVEPVNMCDYVTDGVDSLVFNRPAPSWYLDDYCPTFKYEGLFNYGSVTFCNDANGTGGKRYVNSPYLGYDSASNPLGVYFLRNVSTKDEVEPVIKKVYEENKSYFLIAGASTNDIVRTTNFITDIGTRYLKIFGGVITKAPNERLPFEAILDPIGFLNKQSSFSPEIQIPEYAEIDGVYENTGELNNTPLKLKRHPGHYFLMTPNYYEYNNGYDFEDNQYYSIRSRSNGTDTYRLSDKYNFPYFDASKLSRGDSRYEMAINNFLAEVPRFFLKNESMTVFESSAQSTFKVLNKNTTYFMDIAIQRTKNDFSPVYSPNGFGAAYFGPPVKWKERVESDDRKFDSAYAPYVPPYFLGQTVARIKFTPTEDRKYTLAEIHAGAEIEQLDKFGFVFDKDVRDSETVFGEYENSPSWNSKMPMTSSLNLFGTSLEKTVTYDVFGNALTVTDNETNSGDKWVIYPRFECPILNFNNEDNYTDSQTLEQQGFDGVAEKLVVDSEDGIDAEVYQAFHGFNGEYGNGPWSGYGVQDSSTGVEFEIAESGRVGTIINQEDVANGSEPQYSGSLIEACGFIPTKVKLGQLADSKKITEAVVMIPFLDDPASCTIKVDDRNFIKVSEQEFAEQFRRYRDGLSAENPSYTILDEVIPKSSITKMIDGMEKYNIPPRYDFLKNGGKAFVMYFFEFEHTLDKEDLQNIWQGLPPKISKVALRDSVEMSHPINPHEFFGDIEEIPENIRWMIFKVKRKASVDYYELTADSADDARFKFNFRSRGNVEPEYSYNYPYDFFTMLDRIKVDFKKELSGNMKEQFRRKFAIGEDGFGGI